MFDTINDLFKDEKIKEEFIKPKDSNNFNRDSAAKSNKNSDFIWCARYEFRIPKLICRDNFANDRCDTTCQTGENLWKK